MNRFIESVYFKSPTFIQNAAVSAYGYRLRSRRYGGRSEEYVAALMKTQHYSAEEMHEYQSLELRNLLRHAFINVPYYRHMQHDTGAGIEDFSSVAELQKLPILEKDQIREDPNPFVAEKLRVPGKVFELNTSGTSGKPLTVYCDVDSRRRHYAFWRRLREWFGIGPNTIRCTFFGRIAIAPEQARPPFWRHDFFQRNVLFSSYHMSKPNLKHYYDKLVRMRPKEIIGYPSSLFTLAKYMVENGLKEIRPRAIFTTAETLLARQRAVIEEAFERQVADQYGCTEMALFVSQCEKGAYHVHPEHGIVEVVDANGNPLPPGEEGEAVCTGFVNYAMPLIRYKLGDRITLGSEQCACGRSFPVVKEMLGRVDDILTTPEGRPLGRLDPVFKGMNGIFETQIVQTATDRLVFRMVTDPSFSPENREELLYEVRKRTGNNMVIEIEIVDEIPKDENGKFRSVISNI